MGFEEFLPDIIKEEDNSEEDLKEIPEKTEKVNQNQVYDVITSKKPDWQAFIYELISSEQLDPWDIDIVILTQKYFEKIAEIEKESQEDIDFYISSKVLLAAALLLRIKSEFLLNKHIQSIDEILFGKKEDEKKDLMTIEINEDEIPILIPKTPLSRLRRITLPELMSALNKAMDTESRRIKREVAVKRAHKMSHVDIPKFKRIDLKDRVKQVYARILLKLNKKETQEKHLNKICYSNLIGTEKEEKIAGFLPILHLSNTQKLWLEQEDHLRDIDIYLYKYFNKNRDKFLEELEEDIEEMKEELIENVEGEKLTGLQKAKIKREERKKLAEEISNELSKELGIEINEIEKDEKIEDVTGFSSNEL